MLTRKNALLLGLPVVGIVLALWWSRGWPVGWNQHKVARERGREGQPDEETARRLEAAHRRRELKWEAVRELIRGRLNVDQVAARFEEVDEVDPDSRGKFRCFYEGKSDREWRYRQVLQWAERVTKEEFPDKAATVMHRLEEEVERNLLDRPTYGESGRPPTTARSAAPSNAGLRPAAQ